MDKYILDSQTDVPCPAPFPTELLDDTKEMLVKENTKFKNIIGFVNRLFENSNCRRVLFKGVGEATAKCISCVEVFKRNYQNGVLYQWNKIIFTRRTDNWKPVVENLNPILIHVDVPTIFILISRDPFEISFTTESFQCSSDLVTGYAFGGPQTADISMLKSRREKPKLQRPSEPNKWTRMPKRGSKAQRQQQPSPIATVS